MCLRVPSTPWRHLQSMAHGKVLGWHAKGFCGVIRLQKAVMIQFRNV